MVGSGLAGGSAAATLGELGYHVDCFCYQDSEGHIQLQRVALTPPRIIKMTVTVYTGYFTTLLKEEIFDQEKQCLSSCSKQH